MEEFHSVTSGSIFAAPINISILSENMFLKNSAKKWEDMANVEREKCNSISKTNENLAHAAGQMRIQIEYYLKEVDEKDNKITELQSEIKHHNLIKKELIELRTGFQNQSMLITHQKNEISELKGIIYELGNEKNKLNVQIYNLKKESINEQMRIERDDYKNKYTSFTNAVSSLAKTIDANK